MKLGFLVLIIGSFLVLFGFSFFILFVSSGFGKAAYPPIMRPMEGFDYAVFVIGRSGFMMGMVGVIIQAVGGVILFIDRKNP